MTEILNKEQMELISKFAEETSAEIKENVSKFSNEIDAAALDSGSATVTRKFSEMIRLVKPMTPLVEAGIVRVQEVEDNVDYAIFTVQGQQSYTWTTFDLRGSETTTLAAGSGSYQSYNAPSYTTVQPLTKTTTLSIQDNTRLVNPVRVAEIMAQTMEEVAYAKEADAYSILGASGSYTASVSIKFAGGYSTASGYITSANVLTFSDLDAAEKDLKTSGTRKIKPNVCLVATEQFHDLAASSELAPGQTSSGLFKRIKFDAMGNLIGFSGLEIVESQQMPQVTTGYFASSNGHYAYVGQKGLILGRGENSKLNKVERFRDPKSHTTEYTMDVNYAHGHLYSKAMRAIVCSDA